MLDEAEESKASKTGLPPPGSRARVQVELQRPLGEGQESPVDEEGQP